MDRNQKPFETHTPGATASDTSAQRFPTGSTTGQTASNDPRSAPHGSSFVGHVPGSNVEAGDRPSAYGKSTVQRDAQMASEDQTAAPMAAAGHKLEEFAGAIRDRAPEGKVGELVTNTASALERSGGYLGSASMESVRGDMESLIRRYPVQSLAVGLGIGFLMARALRR